MMMMMCLGWKHLILPLSLYFTLCAYMHTLIYYTRNLFMFSSSRDLQGECSSQALIPSAFILLVLNVDV
jgi:hypothetical protein